MLNSTEETADTSRMTQYYYDKNGNTISKATMEFATSTGDAEYTMSDTANSYVTFYGYNSYNLLTSAETDGEVSKYTYNADNLRTTKTVGNTTTEYVWDGQNLAAETKQGTTDTYTYDMTGVHTRKQGDIVTSYLKDYHGNIVGTADSTGRLDYDAYGNQIQGDTPDPFGYCGEYYDSETGLIYLRNRYYDPATSRMLSEDTHWNTNNMIYGDKEYKAEEIKVPDLAVIMQAGNYISGYCCKKIIKKAYNEGLLGESTYNVPDLNAVAQSSNLYVFCANNPISNVDPSGENFAAEWLAWSWWLAGADGPLPVGEAIIVGGVVVGVLVEGTKIIFAKGSKLSDKDKANDIPSWAKGKKPKGGESGSEYAKRLCDEKYGKGNYKTGPGSEYNKLKKYGDRGGK